MSATRVCLLIWSSSAPWSPVSLISLVDAEKDFGIRTLFADLTLHISNDGLA